MGTITIDTDELQKLVRSSLIAILKDREDMMEIIEDLVFGDILQNTKTGDYAGKQEVMEILDTK